MKLSIALEGYILDIQTSYSPATVRLYSLTLPKLVSFLDDPEIEEITLQDLQRFILHLQTAYQPIRPGGDKSKLSPSAVANYWKSIRSFFTWADTMFDIGRPDSKLTVPAYKLPEVIPFTETEVQSLIKACAFTDYAKMKNGTTYRMRRPTGNRDRAIILVLLDTGLRVGELCRLTIQDINLETGEVLVAPFGSGQKTRPRIVYLGKTTRRQLWIYLAKDRTDAKPKESLFKLSPVSIRSLLYRLGEKAGVPGTHPHKFRYTFAIMALRNGMDVFSLQRILGHSDLTMVRHYLALADTDVAKAHQASSPADQWKLNK